MSDDLLGVIEKAGALMSSTPEGRELFERVRAGDLNEQQATQMFLQLLQREGVMGQMVTAAKELSSLAGAPLMTETSTGLPQLNPVYEAALSERASLDGDVPKLRSGRIPDGGYPAVPVDTDVLDPVLVGELLERASSIVSKRLEEATIQHAQHCNRALAQAVEKGTELELVKKNLPAKPTGVPGYLAGREPEKFGGLVPASAGQVSALPPGKARLFAYRALTSTQGRVSLCRPILLDLLERFKASTIQVTAGRPNAAPSDESLWSGWTTEAFGPEDLSENFNFAAVASQTMFNRLRLLAEDSKSYQLHVLPVSLISNRRFGWSAYLTEEE